jgi:hypothetical protein
MPSLNPYPDLPLLAYKLAFPWFQTRKSPFHQARSFARAQEPVELGGDGASSNTPPAFPDDLTCDLDEIARSLPSGFSQKRKQADVVNLLLIGSAKGHLCSVWGGGLGEVATAHRSWPSGRPSVPTSSSGLTLRRRCRK